MQAIFAFVSIIIAWDDYLTDLITHDVEQDAEAQENYTEHCESDHGRAEGGDGSPCRESLLLEPRILKLFNFLANGCFFLFCEIHF